MIGAGLAGRIRRAGGVGGGFGEQVFRAFQIAVDFIGGDMVEAEALLGGFVQVVPVLACRFQQGVGADDVGFHEGGGAVDGTVYVALCRQMHDGIGLVPL